MKTWFVSRHPGAVFWARDAGVKVNDSGIVGDLDVQNVSPGDVVVGTLPMNLAADVLAKGAKYLHLALNLPADARGRDLTADEMRTFGARLEEYEIRRISSPHLAEPSPGETTNVMVCIASGQTLQNVLPFVLTSATKLYIAVSDAPESRRSAEKLRMVVPDVVIVAGAPAAPLAAVERFASELYARIRAELPKSHIILNATGGTKLMSAGFVNVLGPVGEVIYCDTENDRLEYLQPSSLRPVALPADLLEVESLLAAQGLKATTIQSRAAGWKGRAEGRRHVAKSLIELAVANPGALGWINGNSNPAFSAPRGYKGDRDRFFEPTVRFPKDSKPFAAVKRALNEMADAGLLSWTDEAVTYTSRDAAVFVGGGWIEEWVGLEVADLCKRKGISDGHWAVGVKVLPVDAAFDEKKSLNELDLVVVWRNRLLVVECKTSRAVDNNSENQTMVNKLEAIGHYVGGPFSTKWLATAVPIHDQLALQRCNQFNVRIVDAKGLKKFASLVAEWMQLVDDKPAKREGAAGSLADAFAAAKPKTKAGKKH
ncbi:CRISPR-associated protein Csx16 [Niveibacterium sp. COAC-50]|uniref:CRISPR-associated protein Csx16 n=1 Tax=Niveibacterium sp. COAC-50 TaxID=2729384 RepID=UPI00155821FF|nr:CRISPR-associated protein Csx16 [Niveibacterium sp. COAC-50]